VICVFSKNGMVIEWQKVRVQPEVRDLYLEKDREIWTAGLAREEGFLGKEVWLGENLEGIGGIEIILVIRWKREEDWKGMPKERQDDLDRRFREAVPEGWELVETLLYEVA
jgi:uncharacterized protein (TIGR03792 family)